MEKLKSTYLVDKQNFIDNLFELFQSNPGNFKRNIVFQSFFKDVISMDYTINDFTFLTDVVDGIFEKSTEFPPKFLNDIYIIYGVYESLYFNLSTNTDRLNANQFIKKPLDIQIQTLLSYLQDQYTLSKTDKYSPINKNILTGFDEFVANKSHEFESIGHEVKVSLNEILDTLVEIINLIIPFLYFKKRSEKLGSPIVQNKISPYNDGGFEELLYVTQQRLVLTTLWEKFKYEDWGFFIEKTTETNENIFCYVPKIEEVELANFYGVNRLNYQINSKALLTTKAQESDVRKAYELIKKLSKYGTLDLINNLTEVEYNTIKVIAKKKIDIELKFLDEYYFKLSKNEVNVDLILNFLEFMITISLISEDKKYPEEGIDGDFSFLVPKIRKDKLAKSFSIIKGYSEELSLRVIDIFVYGSTLNRGYDLFSKPLVHIDNQTVIYTPYLFTHLNIQKAVQEWIKQCGFKIAKKGFGFEKSVTRILEKNKYLNIESNIKFAASDGKEIEYDLIAKMGNTTIIIEFKNMFQPYTGKDHFKNMDIIKEGIEQLNRREMILKQDFEIINEKLRFDLDCQSNIIKILCTNVYNYTPLELDGVYITDVSTLGKFFTNPESYYGGFGKKSDTHVLIKYSDAWKGDVPDEEDLINFLMEPESIKHLKNKVSKQFKPVYRTELTDRNIVYLDHYFEENPYIPKSKTEPNTGGRKKPCFCGSGKKYKRCCGKNK
ncbi:SEC-C domain-containing protein [Psychrobacillus sp. Sa2BUA9]|uniref:SEC-C domain-containing protein n=1 Tax=Psychrobacillus faecigallinarum TaxID=2762235 RepID=A0ABR8RDT9_9BACI|nr:NERD domain-containing protein [Psychrobacillus faecigallinarum]MBD7945969.1 SEC-C domain-containing protein [Psychrobacillus faecigallinarum]